METAAGAVAATGADAAMHAQQTIKAAAKGIAAKPSGRPTTGDTIHTLCTSNGSPYLNFQNRIMCATAASATMLALWSSERSPASSCLVAAQGTGGNARVLRPMAYLCS